MENLKWFAQCMAKDMLTECEWNFQEVTKSKTKLLDCMRDAANQYRIGLSYSDASKLEIDSFVAGREVIKRDGEFMDLSKALHRIITEWLKEVQPIIENCIAYYFDYGDDSDLNHECFYQVRKTINCLY